MKTIVVGGGVSGTHAALTLLERGHEVDLWDVGRDETAFEEKGASFNDLKTRLADPITFFLGRDLDALVPPAVPELLRYPPSRRFLASPTDPLWSFISDEFHPYASFAKGGLANGWGANALAYDDDDVSAWPVSSSDMAADYRTVYQRIAVAGPVDDDLSPHLQGAFPSQTAVELSAADLRLLQTYERKKKTLHRMRVKIGRARLAVVTDPARADACTYCDRCLWGCPNGSIYNPSASTLRACEGYSGFRYMPRRFVLSILSRDNAVTAIRYLDTGTQEIRDEPCAVVFLAAGALQTGAIFLRTLKAACPGISLQTEGLLDTTVVRVPYVQLRAIGRPAESRSFQFNRLILGLSSNSPPWPRYLHGELLHLTSLLYHPLIERMPFDSRLSKTLFFALRSAIGSATLFFPDRIAAGNHQALIDHGERWDRVELHYREAPEKETFMQQSVATVRTALRQLGCLPSAAVRSPLGAGIHYAGTVPMGSGPKRCDSTGRSNLLTNLYIADGAAFPTLPSKSITMSLAAHATRVARIAPL